MTALSGDAREQLADRLADLSYRGRQMTGPEAAAYARFLLPTVERLAAEHTAKELRAAADHVRNGMYQAARKQIAAWLRARAAALTSPTAPTEGTTP